VEKSLLSCYTRFVFPFFLFPFDHVFNRCWNCFIMFLCCVVSATLHAFFLDRLCFLGTIFVVILLCCW
jgi:hypothetical protein